MKYAIVCILVLLAILAGCSLPPNLTGDVVFGEPEDAWETQGLGLTYKGEERSKTALLIFLARNPRNLFKQRHKEIALGLLRDRSSS